MTAGEGFRALLIGAGPLAPLVLFRSIPDSRATIERTILKYSGGIPEDSWAADGTGRDPE